MPQTSRQHAKTITVLNLKGGVGKTHTVWLFAGVCQERKLRMLAFDADTQGNLTGSFLAEPVGQPGIEALFHPGIDQQTQELIRSTPYSHIDIVPGSPGLARCDVSDYRMWEQSDLHLSLDVGAIRPPATGRPTDLFEKKAKGSYAIRFHRGPYFEQHKERASLSSAPTALGESPLYEPLRSIGFSDARIRQILARFKRHHIELWSDVTLTKIERDGRESFTNCPEAYFMDNIKAASEGTRTPPDWYVHDRKAKDLARREEERREGEKTISFAQYQSTWRNARSQAFKKYVEAEIGRDEYKRAVATLSDIFSHTMPANEALDRAIRDAERHFMSGFRFPDIATWVIEHKDEVDTTA